MKPKRISVLNIISYIILIVCTLWILMPFIWMILTSLKPLNEVNVMPPKWIPSELKWENFKTAFESVPYKEYFLNSVITSILITLGELITTIFAAFAFSYINFKYKNIIFMLLIATMMIPSEILMIPNYMTLSKLQWIDSYKALILPWCASVFSIFLLRGQFESIPIDYYKSAKIDGCSDIKFLFTILVPMSIPTIVSIAILKFINAWNSYMWPLIVTNTREMRTLPVGLAVFSTEAGSRYNISMAFSLLMILPIIMLYLINQKRIIKGVSKSGLKG